MKLREAHSVANLGHELIMTVSDHSHLRDTTILWLFSDSKPGPRSTGCRALGRVRAASPLDQYLFHWGTSDPGDASEAMRGLEYRYTVLVSEMAWGALKPARQRYLLDDLLSHCQLVENEVSGEEAYIVVPGHPHGGFAEVLERHGAEEGALDDVDAILVRAAHQLPLPPAPETIEQASMPEPPEDGQPWPATNGTEESDQEPRADADRVAELEAVEADADDQPLLDPEKKSALIEMAAQRETAGVSG